MRRAQSHRHAALVSVSLLGTFCLQIPGPDSCVHLRLPGNSNCTQVTALSNFPETQVLAPDGPEDAIPWPETLAEAFRELNSMGPFETGTEKQGHLSAGPSGLQSRPGTGGDHEGPHVRNRQGKTLSQCEEREVNRRGGRRKKKRKGEGGIQGWSRPEG